MVCLSPFHHLLFLNSPPQLTLIAICSVLNCLVIFFNVGVDISNVKRADAGKVLADALRKFLQGLDIPNGISALGFDKSQIDQLVLGTLPQHRVTKLAPSPVGAEELQRLFENSWTLY
jgi:hypothetical protein